MRCLVQACAALAAALSLLPGTARADWFGPEQAYAESIALFRPVDIYVDAGGEPLAAYQIEIETEDATIVGVEGGEHAAFSEPPYYDPAALRGGRIILAWFSTDDDLPSGRTRVATLHMREKGAADYDVELTAAANADGNRVPASVTLQQRD